jgi:hypothetical protein
MASTSPLRDRRELDELPLYLPEQNAVLVGHITDDECEMVGMAAYYVHWRGGVYIGNYNELDNAFTPQYSTEIDERLMSHQVKAFADMDVETELSSIGKALLDAYDFSETDAMADKQAHVFALQSVNGFTRSQTADILNVSPSTVDSQRASATERADAAVAFATTYSEKVGDSDDKDVLTN